MNWRETLHALALELESHAEQTFGARPAERRRTAIVPYRGFGRTGELLVRGRVLVEKPITRAREAEPVWRNILNAYRRFQSDEVAGAEVRAMYRDAVVETVTDSEGHFQVRLQPALLSPDQLWHEVELASSGVTARAEVFVPPPNADLGIISDIDDTIVETGATNFRRMIRSVLLQNAAMRTAFEGVADLYRALQRGINPIFYVSSGPWNLYDLLVDYMDINGIPHGPIFLQDYGLDEATFIHDPHDVHKIREIQSILDYYPALPFVLIGDSGQHDPEIYLRVIQSNPGRIRLVVIRDVTDEHRDRAVATIGQTAAAEGVEMLYVSHSSEALQHAVKLGLAAALP